MLPASHGMSDFDLRELGDGCYELSGTMSFGTADRILTASEQIFGAYENLSIDLSQVRRADSAGLALLLEWKARAKKRAGEIRYSGIPDSIRAIAMTTEVAHLIE